MAKTAKEYFEADVNRLAGEVRVISQRAEDEARVLTDDERATIEGKMKEIGVAKARVQEIDDREALQKSIDDLQVTPAPSAAPEDAKTMGEAFARSTPYQTLKNRGIGGGSWTTGPIEFGAKLTDDGISVVASGDAGGSYPLQPQIARGPVTPSETPLQIVQLFGQGTASQNLIVYLEETTTTPGVLDKRYSDSDANDVPTVEGAEKPAAFIDFTKRSKSLTKLAAFLPVSDEMLEDEPAIVSYINGRLGLFVRQAEEAHVLDELLATNIGSANGSDVGGGSGNWFDAIAAGILRVQKHGGVNPDAILMNPTDFWKMSTSKSAGDGNYFGGSPYRGPSDNPWGVPVVVTNAVAVGRAVVGAFREGGTVWRKGGITVEASNSHQDYFRKNLTAIRAEERLALTVYRPSAFSLTQPA